MESERQSMQPSLRRSIVAGAIGVVVHWFDWAAYAYLATTIAGIFFPAEDDTAALLSVFAVFAVSFAIRPVGAVLFGSLGDRIGRRKTLSLVILLMAGATLLVGLLPDYHSIGVAAPILLVVARLLQGLAAGGEFGSAATFLAEHAPRKHRGFGVSWLEVGSLLGFLLASLLVFVLDSALGADGVAGWAWRIPFLLAAPLGVIGFYIRQKIEDTPDFQRLEHSGKLAERPLRELLARHPRKMAQICGIEIMMHVPFYIVLTYLLTYQEQHIGITAGTAAMASTVTSAVALVLVPVFGALSDRVGRKPLLAGAGAALVIGGYPLFLLMQQGGLAGVLLAQIVLGAMLALILGTHAVAMAELFPTRVRQVGLSVGYNVIAALFAGTVPYLMTYLIEVTGSVQMPAYYLILVGLIGFGTALTLRETVGKRLGDDDPVPGPRSDVNAGPRR